jgi:hypothetical protein
MLTYNEWTIHRSLLLCALPNPWNKLIANLPPCPIVHLFAGVDIKRPVATVAELLVIALIDQRLNQAVRATALLIEF